MALRVANSTAMSEDTTPPAFARSLDTPQRSRSRNHSIHPLAGLGDSRSMAESHVARNLSASPRNVYPCSCTTWLRMKPMCFKSFFSCLSSLWEILSVSNLSPRPLPPHSFRSDSIRLHRLISSSVNDISDKTLRGCFAFDTPEVTIAVRRPIALAPPDLDLTHSQGLSPLLAEPSGRLSY
jgi:hypothetical protein